jgi:hypothetical protein
VRLSRRRLMATLVPLACLCLPLCGCRVPPPAAAPVLPPFATFLPRTSADDELISFTTALDAQHRLQVYHQRKEWAPLAHKLAAVVKQQHRRLTALLGALPPYSQALILVDRPAFQSATSSPDWAKAVSHKGRMFVPLEPNQRLDLPGLHRSLKHEYAHTLVYILAGGKCPGWIDEGWAQWFAGDEDSAANHLLCAWLQSHAPLSLTELQGGFLGLEKERAKIGYAQSRFAVQDLLETHGLRGLVRYFAHLKAGYGADRAFEMSFGLPPARFEQRLRIKLERWARLQREVSN